MKKNLFLKIGAALLFTLGIQSCKNDEGRSIDSGQNNLKVYFSSSIGSTNTRVTGSTWDSKDAIGVFMKQGEGLSNILASNKKYTTEGNGNFSADGSDAINYPETGSVDFIAYYPYTANLSGTVLPVSVATQTNLSAIDVLYSSNATGLNKTSGTANLNFTHKLAKIELSIKAGEGIADINGLSVTFKNVNTTASLDLAKGNIMNVSNPKDVTGKTTEKTAAQFSEAILIPGDYSANTVVFTLPSGTFTWTLPANTASEANKKYSFDIVLKKTATNNIAVNAASTITDWVDVPGGTVDIEKDKYLTENVILLVVDGPRMSETWEAANKENIPNRVNLLQQGVFISNFQNNGTTNTNPGHSAMCSGVYEAIQNNGKELPGFPSIMQQWLKYTGADKTKAWVIASKDKLEVLNNCKLEGWKDKFQPSADCGISGNGSDYREDAITMTNTKEVMKKYSPNIVVINLKDVDSYGHSNNWPEYIKAIKTTDASIKELWDYIQSLPSYKDKTTLIVSNDHGRHIDSKGGFQNHGDDCTGCRHIEFFAMGPDFKKNTTISTGNYEQIDIASTIAELLQFPLQYAKGKVIKDAFK